MHIDTKFGRMVIYCESLPPLKPHDPSITWPTRSDMVFWTIYIYLPFDNTYGHYTWQGAEFREEFQQANT